MERRGALIAVGIFVAGLIAALVILIPGRERPEPKEPAAGKPVEEKPAAPAVPAPVKPPEEKAA